MKKQVNKTRIIISMLILILVLINLNVNAKDITNLKGDVENKPNGLIWNEIMDISDMGYIEDVVYNGKIYLVKCDRGILVSDDGDTWKKVDITGADLSITKIIWNGNQFLALASSSGLYDCQDYYISTDGISWTGYDLDKQYRYYNIIWDGNKYIIFVSPKYYTYVDDGSILEDVFNEIGILYSLDGLKWEYKEQKSFNGFEVNQITDLIYNNKQYLAVGNNGFSTVSNDGINWVPVDKSGDANDVVLGMDFSGVFWDGFSYFASGSKYDNYKGTDTGFVVSSLDGKSWTKKFELENTRILNIACNSNQFVIATEKRILLAESSTAISSVHNIIYSSFNCIDWTVNFDIDVYKNKTGNPDEPMYWNKGINNIKCCGGQFFTLGEILLRGHAFDVKIEDKDVSSTNK